MKSRIVIVMLILFTAGAAVLVSQVSLSSWLLQSKNSNELLNFADEFRAHHTPQTEIDIAKLYGKSLWSELLSPKFNIENLNLSLPAAVCTNALPSDDSPSVSCSDPKLLWDLESGSSRTKDRVLQAILRDELSLPGDFLLLPPAIAADGKSYAYKLTKKNEFATKEWVEANLASFKVSELREVMMKFQINSPAFEAMANLTPDETERMIRGENPILSKDYFLVRNQSQFGFSPLSYFVYPLPHVLDVLNYTDNTIELATANSICLEKVGNVCWTFHRYHLLSYLTKYSKAAAIIICTLLAGLIFLLLKNASNKERLQRKSRLALQVLSHEFRTPLSSMLLIIDQLTKVQARLPEHEQDLITRMSSEVFRLQRVVEVSKTYLQTDQRRIAFQNQEIPSIQSWLNDLIFELDFDVQLEMKSADRDICIDPFWLRYILTTLLHNAANHGRAPFVLRFESKRDTLSFSVRDSGVCEFKKLHQMTDAFMKSKKSQGMGLGLNIAKSVIDEWGGELRFSTAPTTFTLVLESAPRKESFNAKDLTS